MGRDDVQAYPWNRTIEVQGAHATFGGTLTEPGITVEQEP